MDYITTTELRTKSRELVKSLQRGRAVSLMHRSKVVGTFEPLEDEAPTILDIEKFKKVLKAIKPRKVIPKKDREKVYRSHLEKKYGKGLS